MTSLLFLDLQIFLLQSLFALLGDLDDLIEKVVNFTEHAVLSFVDE